MRTSYILHVDLNSFYTCTNGQKAFHNKHLLNVAMYVLSTGSSKFCMAHCPRATFLRATKEVQNSGSTMEKLVEPTEPPCHNFVPSSVSVPSIFVEILVANQKKKCPFCPFIQYA